LIVWLLWLTAAQAADSWGEWLADVGARDGWVHDAERIEQRREALCADDTRPPCEEGGAWEPCAEGGEETCLVAAWAYLERGDVPAAVGAWREACDAGVARACIDLGVLQLSGVRLDDLPSGAQTLALACADGHEVACWRLGLAHRSGLGVPASWEEADRRLTKACDLGHPGGCAAVAEMDIHDAGDAKARLAGVQRLRVSCEQGFVPACEEALRHEREPPAKTGIPEMGCRLGVGSACVAVGLAQPRGAIEARREAMGRGCLLGEPEACTALAVALLDGPARQREADRADRLLSAGCEQDIPSSCLVLGFELDRHGRLSRDVSRSHDAMLRGCDLGLGEACFWASRRLSRGKDIARDAQLAEAYAMRACLLGVENACER